MKLNRLRLRYICQHVDLDWVLPSGLIGVFGSNGAGKSNAFKAAYACLTGDFSVFRNTKAGVVCATMPKGEKSFMETWWEHGGTEFYIKRTLSPDTHLLKVGDASFTKASEIEREVKNLLGIPLEMLSQNIFVRQRKLTAFLEAGPTERAKTYSKLTGTEDSEKLWSLLGDTLSETPVYADSGEVTRILGELDEIGKAIKILMSRVRIAESKVLPDEVKDKHRNLIRRYEAFVAYEKITATANSDLTDAKREYANIRKGFKAKLASYRKRVEELKLKKKAYRKAKKFVSSLDAYHDAEKVYTRCNGEHENALKELQCLVSREPVPDRVKYDKLLNARALLENERQKISAALSTLGSSSICPTCEGEIKDVKAYRSKLENRVAAIDQELSSIWDETHQVEEVFRALEEYKKKHFKVAKVYELAVERLREAKANRIKLKVEDADTYRLIVADYENLEDILYREKGSLAGMKHAGKIKVARIQSLRLAMSDRPSGERPTIAAYDAAKKVLEADATASTLLTGHRRELDFHKKQETTLKQAYNKALDQERRVEKAKQWRARLQNLRELFHRDSLPKIVHELAHEHWIEVTNENLKHFNNPFFIEPTADALDFTFRIKDGPPLPGCLLSSGQMGVLAVAGQAAFNDIFAKSIGFQVLDEPTDGLDDENIPLLEAALGAMSELSKSEGRQVIIVTHEQLLRNAFDCILTVNS